MTEITVVSVTGLIDATAASLAVQISLNNMPSARGLLCSPVRPPNLDKRISHHIIKQINYNEYSWFILFMLWRIVKTEFALIVQDDGWILNPENWTDNYLEYDYIGAPIHLAKIKEIRTTKEHWCRGFEWTKEINDPEKIITNVQNGGFSLRSMKMMRTLCEYNISIEIPPPSLFGGSNLTMEWYNDCLNEDVQLSGILRSRLEGLGLHYAPSSIARQFAIEHSSPILHKEFEYISLFGHHSKLRRLKSIEPLIVEYQISEQQIDNIYGERQIHDLFISLNYLIEYL